MKYILAISGLLIYCLAYAQPSAEFTTNNTEGCGSLQAIFIDASVPSASSNIVSWEWNLGGVLTTKQNPGRIFDTPGMYTICLTVTDAEGKKDTECKTDYIKVYHQPKADFAIDKFQGCSPVSATFTDFSSSLNGKISSWLWDIGGSSNVIQSDSLLTNLSSTYTVPGKYSMSLTIIDEKGCTASVNKKEILEVRSITAPIIRKKYLSTCGLPWIVNVTNENVAVNHVYTWNFGNGQIFTGPNPPNIMYNEKKGYDLTLIISNNECTDTIIINDFINTNPTSGIEPVDPIICLGSEVILTDKSELFADSIKWNLGDGTQLSDLKTVQHEYTQSGCYNISLIRYRGLCIDTLTYNCINVKPLPIINFTASNQYFCKVPATIAFSALGNEKFTWTNLQDNIETVEKNASYQINSFGKYYFKLTAEDSFGCTAVKDSIEADFQLFQANLPSLSVGGCIPYTAILNDSIQSALPIASYEWTLFTPTIQKSSMKSASFLVDMVGKYDLQLIVQNIYGCKDTIFKPGYVQGGVPPTVNFALSPKVDCLSTERQFNQQAGSNANSFLWHFGDGSTSTESNPKHLYTNLGSFDVTLIAFHNGCPSVLTKPFAVETLKPISNFEITYSCDDPYTIILKNLTLDADSLFWHIGPLSGAQDTIRDSILTSFTFPDRGQYLLGIYSKNFTTGCIHETIDTVDIVDARSSYYSVDTLRGCAPFAIDLKQHLTDVDSLYFKGNGIPGLSVNNSIATFSSSGVLELPTMYFKNIHDCIDSFKLSRTVEVNGIKADFIIPNIICAPDTASLFDASLDTFGIVNDWTWKVGDSILIGQNPSILLELGKIYPVSLIVKDNWNCSDTLSISNGIEAVQLNTDFMADTFGCTFADILFVPSGDNINTIGFEWDFGDGTVSTETVPHHTYAQEGLYSVCLNLIDIRGCENQKCKPNLINIKDPKAIFSGDPRFETCPPLLSEFENHSINAIGYEWDFGDNSGLSFLKDPSHIYFEPDSFDVTLVAVRSAACKDTLVLKDYITVLGPKADFSYSLDGNCIPITAKLSVLSDDYYSYFWDYGDGVVDTSLILLQSDEKQYVYNKAGVFIPKIKVSDGNGCSRTFASKPIEVNDVNLSIVSIPETFCDIPAQAFLENTSISSSSNVIYLWTVFHEGKQSSYFSKNVDISITDFGVYDVQLIAHLENCKDTLFEPSVIKAGPKPIVGFDAISNFLCERTTYDFTNTTSISEGQILSWLWDLGNGSIDTTRDSKTTYLNQNTAIVTLTATSDLGCQESSSKTFNIEKSPDFEISGPPLICLEDTATLHAIFNSSQITDAGWSNNTQVLCTNCEDVDVSPSATTTYYFLLQTVSGCQFTDSLVLVVAPVKSPVVAASADTIVCYKTPVFLTILDYNPGYTYQWTGQSGIVCPTCEVATVIPTEDTRYTVTVKNSYGCSRNDSIDVAVEKSIPDFLISEKFICENATTRLFISGGNNPIWQLDPDLSCQACDTVTVKAGSDKYFKVSVTSDNGCDYQDSIFVNHVPLNSVYAGEDIMICNGEIKTFEGIGIGNLRWYDQFGNLQEDGAILNASPDSPQTFILQATKDECVLEDSLYVDVIYKAEIFAVGDTLCFGDTTVLSANGLATDYVWTYNNIKLSTDSTLVLIPTLSTNVYVIGSRTTCENDTVQVYVKVHPEIKYKLTESQYDMYLNNRIVLKAIYDKTQNYTYNWIPSTALNCTNCPEPTVYDLSESTFYKVEITDPTSGCFITETANVRVINECSKLGFYIPNIFTPNSDGTNDEFFILPENKKEFISISILDRWGNLFFQSDDAEFVWDGSFNKIDISSGVYAMIITALCPETGEIYNFGADLTVIK